MDTFIYTPGMARVAEKSVVAIGVFDGVHLAHRALLAQAKEEAQKRALPLGVFTFTSEDMTAKSALPLYPTEEKCRLLSERGCDFALCAPFPLVSSLSAADFVRTVLFDTLGCVLSVCGFNFRFGKNAAGDADTLLKLMKAGGGDSLTVPPYLWQGGVLSTTRIRDLLSGGETEGAAVALGEAYHLSGTVEHGLHIGERIGIPTLNVTPRGGIFTPKPGVYAAYAAIGGERIPALVNLGTCPTFGERSLHAEAHLLEPVGDLYGERVTLSFVRYLREERKYDTAEALLAAIASDTDAARRIL